MLPAPRGSRQARCAHTRRRGRGPPWTRTGSAGRRAALSPWVAAPACPAPAAQAGSTWCRSCPRPRSAASRLRWLRWRARPRACRRCSPRDVGRRLAVNGRLALRHRRTASLPGGHGGLSRQQDRHPSWRVSGVAVWRSSHFRAAESGGLAVSVVEPGGPAAATLTPSGRTDE